MKGYKELLAEHKAAERYIEVFYNPATYGSLDVIRARDAFLVAVKKAEKALRAK